MQTKPARTTYKRKATPAQSDKQAIAVPLASPEVLRNILDAILDMNHACHILLHVTPRGDIFLTVDPQMRSIKFI